MHSLSKKITLIYSIIIPFICCNCNNKKGTTGVEGSHHYTDSFPTNDEYDYQILDPEHAYGSPYGGFSRATRSRLAALPLFLPDADTDDDNNNNDIETNSHMYDPVYLQVRDAEGRLFACRVYHEDELDPSSLEDSMFDAPKLRVKETSPTTTTATSSIDLLDETTDSMDVVSIVNSDYEDGDTQLAISSKEDVRTEISDRIEQLKGTCKQIHTGWWSYQLCFGEEMSQFHIAMVDNVHVVIESFTSLGKFASQDIDLNMDDAAKNIYSDDLPELGRVLDIYDKGGMCPLNNRPRKSFVQYLCCSDKVIQERQSLNQEEAETPTLSVATVMDITEDPVNICTYNITVCTPLLCGTTEDEDSDELMSTTNSSTKLQILQKVVKENETIIEILTRSFSKDCLRKRLGTWWHYEVCYKGAIRQYHETIGTRRTDGGVTVGYTKIDTEHILGKYEVGSEDILPWGEEWTVVQNATSTTTTTTNDVIGRGSGTYYEVEYTDGDFCGHTDVTDSAVVAGTAGSGGLPRASSVRYYCGPELDMVVDEDSTCHYMVYVSVPDLCNHPLFRVPISKKQIMKCLPAVETAE